MRLTIITVPTVLYAAGSNMHSSGVVNDNGYSYHQLRVKLHRIKQYYIGLQSACFRIALGSTMREFREARIFHGTLGRTFHG